jgi:hypothetical protein
MDTRYHSVLLDSQADAAGQCSARKQANPKVAMLPLVAFSMLRSPSRNGDHCEAPNYDKRPSYEQRSAQINFHRLMPVWSPQCSNDTHIAGTRTNAEHSGSARVAPDSRRGICWRLRNDYGHWRNQTSLYIQIVSLRLPQSLRTIEAWQERGDNEPLTRQPQIAFGAKNAGAQEAVIKAGFARAFTTSPPNQGAAFHHPLRHRFVKILWFRGCKASAATNEGELRNSKCDLISRFVHYPITCRAWRKLASY